MKISIFVLLIALVVLLGTKTVLAVETHFTGVVDNNWSNAGNWDAGIPNTDANAYIDIADCQILSFAAEALRTYVNLGNTLTIGTGGLLDLFGGKDIPRDPAIRLGDTGDGNLVIDGGTLIHGAQFGGDIKTGAGEGSTVNIEMKSGLWQTRTLRLGEAGNLNFPPVGTVVHSTTNLVQTGGTIDLQTIRPDMGRVMLAYSPGSTATYTMNGGTLLCTHIFLCWEGSPTDPVTHGTFNLNAGDVDVSRFVSIGYNIGDSGIRSVADFNQTSGRLVIDPIYSGVGEGDLVIALGYKQGNYTISGGDLRVGRTLKNGVDGVGKFRVIGSDVNSITAQNYTQNGMSRLVAEIDSDGITTININDTATFAANAMLEVYLAPGVSVSVPTQYTLMSTNNGITDNGILIVGGSCQFVTYQIVDGTDLVVTYYPTGDPDRCDPEIPICINPPLDIYDLDGDCGIGFGDIAIFLSNWLAENLEPWGTW